MAIGRKYRHPFCELRPSLLWLAEAELLTSAFNCCCPDPDIAVAAQLPLVVGQVLAIGCNRGRRLADLVVCLRQSSRFTHAISANPEHARRVAKIRGED